MLDIFALRFQRNATGDRLQEPDSRERSIRLENESEATPVLPRLMWKGLALLQALDYLARPAGLEPTTPWFVARCSNPTELRARESELYQKLDDAYPRAGCMLAVRATSAHHWHALCAISDVRRRTPCSEAIRYCKCSISGSCCRVSAASAKRRGEQHGRRIRRWRDR